MANNDLQKSNDNTLSTGTTSELGLVKIESSRDLLKTKPIALMVQEHGEKSVLTEIRISVEKCLYRLDIEMDEGRLIMLCKDILEVYSHDSIEDISTCLKRAGQGKYGFGYEKRGVITMVMVAEWMGRLLEEKAQEREKIIKNRKAKITLEENQEISPEAKRYLAQVKAIIKKSIDKEPIKQPVFDHKSDLWIKELKKDRGHRLIYRLVMKKIEAGLELTEKEILWLEAWNIYHWKGKSY